MDIENGNWFRCDVCGRKYSESDGGCECHGCSGCNTEITDEENDIYGELCRECYDKKQMQLLEDQKSEVLDEF